MSPPLTPGFAIFPAELSQWRAVRGLLLVLMELCDIILAQVEPSF